MIELSGKAIEVNNENLLTSKLAVFIVECDYDNRVYVGHAIMKTVKSEIRKFINSALDDSIKCNVLLKESMKNSKTLYVTIIEPLTCTLDELFKLKYDLILSCNSYEPFGFNAIRKIGNKFDEEKKYIDLILSKIGKAYKKVAVSSKARPIKEYRNKGDYGEIAEWPSITEAARHYGLNASNIAACCAGRLQSAYGRVWRYAY